MVDPDATDGVEHGVLALYWSARQEEFEACADKATLTFGKLPLIGFTQFRRLGRSRREAEKLVFEPSPERVAALLRRGVNRNDVDRQPIPDLGWSLRLWSGGADGESFAVSLACGSYSQWVTNSLVVKFPHAGLRVLSKQVDKARTLYVALIRLWQPEQATLCVGEINWNGPVLAPEGECLELLKKGR